MKQNLIIVLLTAVVTLLLVVDAKGVELFVAHSRDNPSGLWAGLDATVKETQRNGRVSIFKINKHKRGGGIGAEGRFFICTVLLLAKQRGYVGYSNAKPIDGHIVVIFLNEYDEDIQALIESGYREYEFFKRVDSEGFAMLEKVCAKALQGALNLHLIPGVPVTLSLTHRGRPPSRPGGIVDAQMRIYVTAHNGPNPV